MKKMKFKKLAATIFATALAMFSLQTPQLYNNDELIAEAVSVDYPPQFMNLSLYDNSKNLTVASGDDKTSCTYAVTSGTLNEQWRIDYCGNDSNGNYYKIVNQVSGRLLTPAGYNASAGAEVVIFGNENDKSQYWYISAVSKDKHNNNLYYKITNYKNSSLALTSGTNTTLSSYSGANNQKWLLNSAGLQGFAGYCQNDNEGNVKAGNTGGVLGQTVEVSTFDDLKKYATADEPYTIIVTKNISVSSLEKDSSGRNYCPAGRIYVTDNKTIIGSYSAHTLNNVQFCTKRSSGKGNNVIIRNFDLQHSNESNGNDSIVVYFGSGQNLWVDHCTFTGHSDYNTASTGLPDWDKFLACCYDADYCTVSDSSFGLHEYGLILGYPDDSENSYQQYNNYPRMSLMGNRFNKTLTRGPGLMRYGYYHSLNNYVSNFSMAYTVHSASKIYAESCYYENGGNVICDWNSITYAGSYAESGSKAVKCSRTTLEEAANAPQKGTATECEWRPVTNYTYKTLTADNSKTHCSTYSGCQTSKNNVKYLTSSSAGIQSAAFMASPESSWEEAVSAETMPVDAYFQIKNVNSGMCLDVYGGTAANGTNVQQWGADSASPQPQNTWRFVASGEEGYYYIQSMVGNKTYVLDVTGGKSTNGTNIEIYNFKGNDNQKFMITKNSNGTYKIRPKVGNGEALVEVAGASKTSGDNVALWEKTGSEFQDWTFTEVTYSGEEMDTVSEYMFKNSNSGMYIEVKDAADNDGTNIQQWSANGSGTNKSGEWNSWKLKKATGDLYFIVSNLEGGRYININNGNAELRAYDKSTSSQMVRFVKNPDGTYLIVTRTGYNKSSGRYTKALEVAGASTSMGANVQEYTLNGNACQNWAVETFTTTAVTTTKATTTTKAATTTSSKPVTTTAENTTAATSVTTVTQVTTTVAVTEPPTNPERPIIAGDVNNDGNVNTADAVLLGKQLTKKEIISEYSDVDQNGKINVFDLILLKRVLTTM